MDMDWMNTDRVYHWFGRSPSLTWTDMEIWVLDMDGHDKKRYQIQFIELYLNLNIHGLNGQKF